MNNPNFISKWLATFLLLSYFSLSACLLAVHANESASGNSFVFQSVGDKQENITSNVIDYDFGTTTQLDDKYVNHGIEHTFILHNGSTKVITITELKPSCICINKNYITDGKHDQTLKIDETAGEVFPDILDLPIKVAPGSQVKVFVSIDPNDVFSGPVQQSVDVMVEKQAEPSATLQMSGILQSGISFSASTLDFHQVPAGKEATLLLTITLDRRLHRSLPFDIRLKVMSNNPDILISRITPVPRGLNSLVPALAPDEIQVLSPKNIVDDFPEDTTVTYKVQLSRQAALGILKGSLYIAAPQYPMLLILVNARVPFAGEVVGDITDSPQGIVFGSIPAGTAATKSVTIMAHLNVKPLKLICPNPNLFVNLISGDSVEMSPKYVGIYKLNVTLSPKTPLGVLEDKVTVVTPSGQHLIVPIFASVYHK